MSDLPSAIDLAGNQNDQAIKRKTVRTKYPRACEILVHTREPTERERWIDLQGLRILERPHGLVE